MSANRFVALLRGINVGGRNLISMADLRDAFAAEGYRDARTYVQSATCYSSRTQLEARSRVNSRQCSNVGLASCWLSSFDHIFNCATSSPGRRKGLETSPTSITLT